MVAALLDSGAMVALFGDHEPHSARYQAILHKAAKERWHLSTTWPCIVEASYLLGPRHRYPFMRWIAQGAVTVFPLAQESLNDLADLMERYTQVPRTEMDLADASLVWLAGETGVTTIMTLDVRDFSRYRLANGQGFDIL